MTTITVEKLRVIRLEASNFKRIVAVHLTPSGHVQIVSGKNGQGKSSLLDAIVHTLASARKVKPPKLPIRTGARRGKVTVELGDDKPLYKVTRTWTEKDDKLVVEGADGTEHKSPQTLLDRIVGDLSWDALAFSRMDGKARVGVLRKLVPELDMTDLDLREEKLRQERTVVGRLRDELKGQLAGIAIPAAPVEPAPVGVDTAALTAELREHEIKAEQHANATRLLEMSQQTVEGIEVEIERAKAKLEDLKRAHEEQATAWRETAEKVAALPSGEAARSEIERIKGLLANASARNREVAQYNSRVEMRAAMERTRNDKQREVGVKVARYDELTDEIMTLGDTRRERLVKATLPLPGLTISADDVLVEGVPFDQLAKSQQIRLGLEIGARANPTLRVLFVYDGSLLDEDGMRLVGEFAERNDMQVWIEQVARGQGVGIVIEDGMLAADTVPAQQQQELPTAER